MVLYERLLPLWLLVGLGVLLRRGGFLTQERSTFLLQLVVFVALPATIFRSLQGARLEGVLWILPMASVWIVGMCGVLSWWWSRGVWPMQRRGVLVIAPMVMNLGTFVYPFVLAMYGEKALSALIFLDFANILLSASLVYVLSVYYGSARRLSVRDIGVKLGRFPLFWVLLLALLVRVLGVGVPRVLWNGLGILSGLTIPLSLLAMGGLLTFRGGVWKDADEAREVLGVLGIRFVGGLLCAGLWVFVWQPGEMFAKVILLAGTAPVAFTVLAYAVQERLDAAYMARLLSLSLLLGLVYTPTMILCLSWWYGR